ncbi:MAG: hypothetical protein ABFQ65_04035 [Nanoarchaeota archaeon]
MKQKYYWILGFVFLIGLILIFNYSIKDNTPNPPLETDKKCGIENCHGIDITCGSEIPEFCTEIYMIGDFCREFAQCEIIGGTCQLTENSKFNECKSCVEKCNELIGPEAFACENNCREK